MYQSTSAARARSYYSSADYYSEGQEVVGRWGGKGAELLGLSGIVKADQWDSLRQHRNPATGGPLTPRRRSDRSIGYDFNFNAPKSVSVLFGLSGDQRILTAFRDAVDTTMAAIEEDMQTRVRSGGRDEERTTGNMVWGKFDHFTARPVGGVPDPSLHAHCFVFNATFDREEGRWKAGQFRNVKRDAPYYEALFHSRLSDGLASLGLSVERTATGWEAGSLASDTLKKFSRRTELIEALAKSKGITAGRAKDELGAMTRERKQTQLTMDELRREWWDRLDGAESAAVERALAGLDTGMPQTMPGAAQQRAQAAIEAVRDAADHCFERSSVAPERRVLAAALKRGVGRTGSAEVRHAFDRANFIAADIGGQRVVTTRAVLEEERRMLEFARSGRGACTPLGGLKEHAFTRPWLNDEQKRAVDHVIRSQDRVTLVRGAAGVGKTSMMQEAVEALQSSGRKVFTFAPSADASRGVLREKGFDEADTVARMLSDTKIQERVQGAVIWVDESGLIGTRTMGRIFDLARTAHARVVLTGDTRQHGSVERGAALRLLETEAGLRPAAIREIQRQSGAYKKAIRLLSEGDVEGGFRRLDALGWIREVPEDERYRALAEAYLESLDEGKTAAVICPTHREGARINDTIRSELKARKLLGSDERVVSVLIDRSLTEAQRRDPASYHADDMLVFHQNAKGGIRRGQRVALSTLADGQADRERAQQLLAEAAKFQVYRPGTLSLAPGDKLRITRNGVTADGAHRLNNGAVYTLSCFDSKGDLVLDNGWTVAKDYGHVAHGYVSTSYASQGKDVKRVFIGQSSDSFGASSREQFYVSASRGREMAVVFCDNKKALLEAVSQSDQRLTATELIRHAAHRVRIASMHRHREEQHDRTDRERARGLERE